MATLVATPGVVGDYAWTVLSRSLAYAARRLPEIADSVSAVDDAMKWGYGWDLGPFETWDALGFAETTTRMRKHGLALPAWLDGCRGLGIVSQPQQSVGNFLVGQSLG